MKATWGRVSGVVLVAVLALGMVAPGLPAGPIETCRFNLPFDAQLGKLVLRTGAYKFSLGHASTNGTITIYQGAQIVGLVQPQMLDGHQNQSENPVLVCIRHDGNVTVRALRLPNVGTYYFSLPKELKVLVAQQPQLIETVSVEASAD
jgi:hypothetical protein